MTMKPRLARILVARILVLCAGLVGTATAACGQEGIAPDSVVTRIVRERVDARGTGGIVVGVLDADGSTRYVAYGSPGPGARPLDEHSVFEIGSITKVFTGILLAEMATRGEVALNDPVTKYLPESVRVPSKDGREITLLDLSVQISGLPRMPANFSPRDPRNPYADYSPEQMYEFLSGHELRRAPGAQYEYSNLGVGLLGHALARRAHTDYETLVRQRILEPLGMRESAITLSPDMRARLALGHSAAGDVVPNWDLPTFAGAGALRSTAADMLRFAAANLSPADTPLGTAMAASHEPRFTAQPHMRIGMNWHIYRPHDRDIVWHNGGTGGYRTFFGMDKQRRVAVVVLSNVSGEGDDDIGNHLLDARIPLRTIRKAIALAADVLQQYVGTYQLAPTFSIEITREGDRLFGKATGQDRFPLFAEAKDKFFLRGIDAQLTFQRSEAGEVTGLVLHQNGRDMPGKQLRRGE
jgi:serine-type D-Ala-D-Ala carboxypeptidase/endopeptidase